MTNHLTTLKQFQAWRRGTDDHQKIPMPDPKEIGKALDFAIRELEKAKRGICCPECNGQKKDERR